MKKRLLLCTMLLGLSAGAEGFDPMMQCDNEYGSCNSECDAIENVSSECYLSCDNTYQKCLDVANGYSCEPGEPIAPKTENQDTNTSAA
jgi:hypothetical protein